MEAHAEEASKAVISANKKLQHALNQKEPDYAAFEQRLEKLRICSGNLALLCLTTENPAEDVETRLWNAHVQVNGAFKTWLRIYREGDRRKHVERRKAAKLYVDFTKSSQRFYRAYIGRLVANFTNISKVVEVAEKLGQVGLTAQVQKPASDEQRKTLESSCRLCVIRLGDLSRWRETEAPAKQDERNWGPAKGYYQLALSMDPAEGICYNQLAVIARNDNDHLGTVYYLHRATAVIKPFPSAADNIKVEFDKLITIRKENSLGIVDRSRDDDVTVLEKRFLAFHAHCYARPYDFVAFQQKAKDILDMIATCYEESTPGLDHFLQRACLVNIAAEALAQQGMTKQVLLKKLNEAKLARETERNCQSFFLLQRFNLMTFRALLRVLARELGDPPAVGQDLSDLSRLSKVVRRVLPHLRQYSSWFLSHTRELVETKFKSSRKFLEEVAGTYASTLNLLRSHIDVFAPAQVTYLLEEDERTISFSPFSAQVTEWRYYQADKVTLKPISVDLGHGKEMSVELAETHLRAIDLVVDALRLVKHQNDLNLTVVPLELADGHFVTREIPEVELPKPPPSPPKQVWRRPGHAPSASLNGVPDPPSRPTSRNMPPPAIVTPEVEMSDIPIEIHSTNNARMPQDSIASETMVTATEEPPATFNSSSILAGTPAAPANGTPPVPTNGTLTAMDLVRRMQQRSSGSSPISQRSPDSAKKHVQPSLPSVYNTAFAPTPVEQAQLSPRLGLSQMRSPSFHSPRLDSSAMFQENIEKQQREIEMRSSPQPSVQPTQSWFGATPTGLETLFRAFEDKQERTPSPFAKINGRSPQPPQSPFGVIGQARPLSRGTPPNGQG